MRIRRTILLVALAVSTAGIGAARTSDHAGAGADVQPTQIDHFKCYPVAALQVETHPLTLTLEDPFGNADVQIALRPFRLCNPAEKTHGDRVFPPRRPESHLLCYAITQHPTTPAREVRVTNQFGSARLTALRPSSLCLPSWKKLTPNELPAAVQPPGLDHLKCYTARYSTVQIDRFENQPPVVGLRDQFEQNQAQVRGPVELCNPVKKTLPTGQATPILRPKAHLMCFSIQKTPPHQIRRVFTKNQFGRSALETRESKLMCLPSYKRLINPTPA
jgi:hypothetical protein